MSHASANAAGDPGPDARTRPGPRDIGRPGAGGSVAARIGAALERLANAQRRLVQDLATRHGLSPLQIQVLGLLRAGPPPPPRGSALSRELGVSQPTLSDAVAALRGKGYVEQVPDPHDGRVNALALSPAGHDVALRLESAGGLVAAAVATLPEHQQEEVLLALLRLIRALAAAGIVSVERTCLSCRFHEERSARCTLLGAPLPTKALRVDCPDHRPR